MQRYNFQFTGQRFYRIRNGQLAGQLKDVAYQATTTDFWNSMEAVGGPQTYVLGGAFNCGKGQPGQVAPVSHGAPSALFRDVRVLNVAQEGTSLGSSAGETERGAGRGPGKCVVAREAEEGLMTSDRVTAQDTVERALAAAKPGGDLIVIADEHSTVNLRWAGNTLTTNGVAGTRSLTVIAIDRRGGDRRCLRRRRRVPVRRSPRPGRGDRRRRAAGCGRRAARRRRAGTCAAGDGSFRVEVVGR